MTKPITLRDKAEAEGNRYSETVDRITNIRWVSPDKLDHGRNILHVKIRFSYSIHDVSGKVISQGITEEWRAVPLFKEGKEKQP